MKRDFLVWFLWYFVFVGLSLYEVFYMGLFFSATVGVVLIGVAEFFHLLRGKAILAWSNDLTDRATMARSYHEHSILEKEEKDLNEAFKAYQSSFVAYAGPFARVVMLVFLLSILIKEIL